MLQLADEKANVSETMDETVEDTKMRLLDNENEMVCTSDEIIEKLSRNRSWKFNAYVFCLIIIWLKDPTCVYLTAFAGNKHRVSSALYTAHFIHDNYYHVLRVQYIEPWIP